MGNEKQQHLSGLARYNIDVDNEEIAKYKAETEKYRKLLIESAEAYERLYDETSEYAGHPRNKHTFLGILKKIINYSHEPSKEEAV